MAISDKLSYLGTTKDLIRQSVVDKGVEVPTQTTFRAYKNKIAEIQAGPPIQSSIKIYHSLNVADIGLIILSSEIGGA